MRLLPRNGGTSCHFIPRKDGTQNSSLREDAFCRRSNLTPAYRIQQTNLSTEVGPRRGESLSRFLCGSIARKEDLFLTTAAISPLRLAGKLSFVLAFVARLPRSSKNELLAMTVLFLSSRVYPPWWGSLRPWRSLFCHYEPRKDKGPIFCLDACCLSDL